MSEIPKIDEKLSTKFISSIKMILFQSQILGLITFSHTQTKFRFSKLRRVYNILAIFLYLPVTVLCVCKVVALERLKLIFKSTDIIILIMNAVYVTTTWVCAIKNRDKFIDFLEKIIDFDINLQADGVYINYKRNEKRILVQIITRLIVLFSVITTLMSVAVINIRHFLMSVECMAYFLLVINSAICHQSIEMVLMLKARYTILNKQIRSLIEYFKKNNIRTIGKNNKRLNLSKICAMHHHLTKLVKLFNEIFGVVLLLMFCVSFVVIVITLFYLTGALQAPRIRFWGIFNPILSNVTLVMDVIYVCDVCYSTIEEANKSGELIHKIDTEDHDIRDEIEMFSLQIANAQVEFNAAGFFPINYTLVFSIIGGVTTYIIILIQLSATLTE
ncbi:gustatory receptor 28b [Asbolus verrucosus]|uniref:Gustatory receptor n=1 Tax=Asbolus verrucosus TaxID=1661398 RepID=A0A482VZH8_ASBVE|nr:gustatory receptor 28b [Asbolus verrucosus]